MEEKEKSPVSIYALGGLNEVGKNMYCIEDESSIIIIDCGVKFPDMNYPGINYIVPDFSHLKNNRSKIKALIITHGHEDHIGGIQFLLQNVNIPFIYAPRLASALIKYKLEDARLSERTRIVEFNSDSKIKIDNFVLSFFRVTHSIPDSFGIVVDTFQGRIVTTGDFKIDLTPIGPDIELTRIAEIGKEGVDLLLSDSTNAEIEGYTPSEKNVYDSIENIFQETYGRLIISTFSSNISRLEQICDVAVKYNRKIVIVGRSMEKAVEIARNFGYIKIPDSSLIKAEETKSSRIRNNEILILCTGSQGEPMSALSRIATGENKDISILFGDTVVFSSSAIPGNGVSINHIVNLLTRKGANVITNSIITDIHSSGHPSKQELRLMLKLMNPKHFMPIHGDYRMLRLHGEIAESLGVLKQNIFICSNGDVLRLFNHKVGESYEVEHGDTFIDGKDIHSLSEKVISERKHLSADGLLIITIGIDSKKKVMIKPSALYLKGLIFQDDEHKLNRFGTKIDEIVIKELSSKANENVIKKAVKDFASNYFYSQYRVHPIILPVIMDAN